MNKSDFKFIEAIGDTDGVNKDYWYEINRETNHKLTGLFKGKNVVSVPLAIYVKSVDTVFIKRVFENSSVDYIEFVDNDELHVILKELSEYS
jgi:hypothetical protein